MPGAMNGPVPDTISCGQKLSSNLFDRHVYGKVLPNDVEIYELKDA